MRNGVALVLAALALVSCAASPVERIGAPQVPVVGRSYPRDLATLRSAILHTFADRKAFHSMQAAELKPEGAFGWVDPGGFLEAYNRIPVDRRANDLLIEEATGDVYWPSEYAVAGQPVRFRCGFILHLSETGNGTTEAQVYEKVPQIWVGEHWALSRHGVGFGKVHDIRFVEPTVKDRLDLLGVIGEAAGGGR